MDIFTVDMTGKYFWRNTMAKKKATVSTIFEFDDDDAEDQWSGMPEFNQPDNGAYRQIIVSFDDEAGVRKFAELIGQHLTEKTKSIWFPGRERNNVTDLFWFDRSENNEE